LSATAYTVNPVTKLPTNTPIPSGKVSLSLSGNQLRITRAAGYTGDFYVNVTANDGTNSAVQSFKVTATNSNVTWLKQSPTSVRSVVEDLSQQLDMAENAMPVFLPALEPGSNITWPNAASLTQSYDIIGSATRGNTLSLFNNGTAAEVVELAFHDSHIRGDSWVSSGVDNLNGVMSNITVSGGQVLHNGINNRVRNISIDSGESGSALDISAESRLLQEIEESLQSLATQSSDHGSVDNYFAALSAPI
jgi:hypothetical protein